MGCDKNETVYSVTMEVKRIKGEKNGKKYDFLDYKGYTNKGKKCRFKFTRNCKNVPDSEGIYIVTVNKGDMNQDKSCKFLEFWVKNIVTCKTFDGVENSEDLPF